MQINTRPPSISTVPTITEGEPPDSEMQKTVIRNQVRSDLAWTAADESIALSNMVNERDQVRDARLQVVVLAVIAIALFLFGSLWTYQNLRRDRVMAAERAAAEKVPYNPRNFQQGP